jgi:HlyD family secretion protein
MNNRLFMVVALAVLAGCGDGDSPYRVVGELTSDRIELTAETNEPITAIKVSEGESVAAGQVLLEQDPRRAAARLSEAEALLAQVQARLDELVRGPRSELIEGARANVEGAAQELAFRQAELDRMREVHARGLASPETLDQAQAALDAAQAAHKLRVAQLEELLAGTTVEELAQAEQAVRQAAARRDAAEVDLDRHTLRSPVDGIADARLFELGERPTPGQAIFIILGGQQTYARVFVPESVRVTVTPGTAARVHVDGLAEPLAGRVRWISSDAAFTPYYALTERDRSRLTYVAKVDITEEHSRLPDGVPVEVELLVAE